MFQFHSMQLATPLYTSSFSGAVDALTRYVIVTQQFLGALSCCVKLASAAIFWTLFYFWRSVKT